MRDIDNIVADLRQARYAERAAERLVAEAQRQWQSAANHLENVQMFRSNLQAELAEAIERGVPSSRA